MRVGEIKVFRVLKKNQINAIEIGLFH
jgi:hypothetical protein